MVDGRLEVQHGRIKPFYASDSSPRFMGRKEKGGRGRADGREGRKAGGEKGGRDVSFFGKGVWPPAPNHYGTEHKEKEREGGRGECQ